ncbi:protein bric-a-brac 1-like [Apis mellifera caucasica]|nr:protein bric-a-brac 1-like [Apis mellifera caucasica]KAG9432960.1 protein bric-a-brac 1-like [Apis mellifera carnica]
MIERALPIFPPLFADHEKEGYDKLWPMKKRARARVRAGARARRASGFVEEGGKRRRRGGTSNTDKKINTRSDVSGH